jgi:anthranilate synthase/indole-3-glycerol phosphate synthase/phosphoribosylanthranilate isomerase
MEVPSYTPLQLKEALDSLNNGSLDPSFDARHIYGYGDDNHGLSMLQTITATTLLDYRAKMVRENNITIVNINIAHDFDMSHSLFSCVLYVYQLDDSFPSEQHLLQRAKDFAETHGPILNLQRVIQSQSPRMALAAEFKRASPSKGDIAPHLRAGQQSKIYASAGAIIVSVLTEPYWFKGSLKDLTEARLETNNNNNNNNNGRPAILRKDFVIDKYMIVEAAASGADTVLLIVATLPQFLLKQLIDYSRSLGMEPLVEVHADVELQVALEAGAKVIGVNNRNLHTFQLDLTTTQHVARQLQERSLHYHHDSKASSDYTLCALSGMSTALDVDRYRACGVGMCLIGESLMRAADPSAAIASLCLHPDDVTTQNAIEAVVGGASYTGGTKLIKVCGITNAEDALAACRAGANWIGVIFVPNSKRCVSPEQALEVVQAVRSFGERSGPTVLSIPDTGDKALPRLVAAARALEEAARRGPMVVGVFQNQSSDFIQEMVATCGLDLVQLHGVEGMAAANAAKCGAPAIRVVDIETDPNTGKAETNAAETLLDAVTTDPIAILLDTSIKGTKDGGGTGVTFDWSIAQQMQNGGLPVIIAGGLNVNNIKDAVGTIRPWGVDVSSGVEASPGKKDLEKVQNFVKNARDAAIEASKGF